MGLPYTFVLFWCSQALLLLVKEESGELAIDRKGFSSFLFTPPVIYTYIYIYIIIYIDIDIDIEREG